MYNKCIDCPFHKIIPDPDPSDWFNVDDVAIVCTKSNHKPDPTSDYAVDRQSFTPIDVGLRPYQAKNVDAPDWCPISISKKRDEVIEKILN